MLVTGEPDACYPALVLARAVDPRLQRGELAAAIRTALDDPLAGYADAVVPALAPFSAPSVDRVVADQVLPALLGGA
jgi:hypothetical protein